MVGRSPAFSVPPGPHRGRPVPARDAAAVELWGPRARAGRAPRRHSGPARPARGQQAGLDVSGSAAAWQRAAEPWPRSATSGCSVPPPSRRAGYEASGCVRGHRLCPAHPSCTILDNVEQGPACRH
eukprot:2957817-Pyramimonas_sp.AAC.1